MLCRFHVPSAPSPTQTRKMNGSITRRALPTARGSTRLGVGVGEGPAAARCADADPGAVAAGLGTANGGSSPAWRTAACRRPSRPADALDALAGARVQVPTRPDWFFVKLHAHGAPERDRGALLGQPMVRLPSGPRPPARRDDPRFHYHYVTAREMYNLAGPPGRAGRARLTRPGTSNSSGAGTRGRVLRNRKRKGR